MPVNEPMMLGEYRLLEKLGQGGMAMVYRAERKGEAGFKKTVAIKRMIPEYRRSNSLLERFAAEARTNARLDHPNLIAVVDFGTAPEPFLVMEFVEGITLATLLSRLVKNAQPLEIAAACFIGTEAAQGLDHAHRKRDESGNPLGIVHRDVSPQNILLSNEGAVKVSDFGLVKAADNVVQTGSGVPIGKLSYMAPEQADHREVDARADVFSLGIVLWEMLAMRVLLPPNDPGRTAVMLQACEFPPPSKYRPEIPPELDEIVMACLTKDPSVRTPSMQAMGMRLREVLHEVAPGYGRDQLARLLGWSFPERGWQHEEPHAPPKQPSAEERLSIPPAPAMRQSVPEGMHPATQVDVRPADPLVTGPHLPVPVVDAARASAPPAKASSSLLWIALGAVGIGVVGIIGIAILFFVYASYAAQDPQSEEPPMPVAPMIPDTTAGAADVQGMTLETQAQEATLYRGAELVGRLPLFLPVDQLDPGPLIVISRQHHPAVLDRDQMRQRMSRGRTRMVVAMLPASRPERAILIRHPRDAEARIAHTHAALGPVPGLVLVPSTRMGGSPAVEILEDGVVVGTFSTQSCDPAAVCARP